MTTAMRALVDGVALHDLMRMPGPAGWGIAVLEYVNTEWWLGVCGRAWWFQLERWAVNDVWLQPWGSPGMVIFPWHGNSWKITECHINEALWELQKITEKHRTPRKHGYELAHWENTALLDLFAKLYASDSRNIRGACSMGDVP